LFIWWSSSTKHNLSKEACIRNAICTALHAFNNYEKADAAARFVDFNFRMIPKHWEKPELLNGYVKMWNPNNNLPGAGAVEAQSPTSF
jgi:hypothetical protein